MGRGFRRCYCARRRLRFSEGKALGAPCRGRYVVVVASGVELGLLAAQVTLGLRHPHALACPGPDEIGLKFGHHGKDVEQQPADRVGRVVYRPTEAEPHRPAGEVFSDRPCVGQ